MYVDPNKDVEANRKKFLKELQQDERVKEFLKPYRKEDFIQFLDSYALSKARLHVQGNYTINHHEYLMKEWTKNAWQALRHIQNKKLFDQQCLWRAGQRDRLEGIDTTFDFDDFENHILDYNGIPIVTKEEVQEYIDFLETRADRLPHYYFNYCYDYQDYDMIKQKIAEDNDDTEIEYYDYMYIKYGGRDLLMLPDIQREKEDFYIKRSVQKNKEEKINKQKAEEPKKPQKQYLYSWDIEKKVALSELLEEKKVGNFIKDIEQWVKEKPDFEVDVAVDYLLQCYPEKVPIGANHDWQQAVMDAVTRHKILKTAEMLPSIYEMYLLKKQTMVAIEEEKEEKSWKRDKWWREMILKGRELNGEPRDFNF